MEYQINPEKVIEALGHRIAQLTTENATLHVLLAEAAQAPQPDDTP